MQGRRTLCMNDSARSNAWLTSLLAGSADGRMRQHQTPSVRTKRRSERQGARDNAKVRGESYAVHGASVNSCRVCVCVCVCVRVRARARARVVEVHASACVCVLS